MMMMMMMMMIMMTVVVMKVDCRQLVIDVGNADAEADHCDDGCFS